MASKIPAKSSPARSKPQAHLRPQAYSEAQTHLPPTNPTSSLLMMAARAASRNINDIVDVGTMPYDIAWNVLKCIKNPAQLHEIEENCPHIADQDAELWKGFIARDIPNWEAKMIYPKNPRSWHKVYRKLMREEELINAAQEDALRKQLVKDTIAKSEQSTTFVPHIVKFAPTKLDTTVVAGAAARAASHGWQWREKPKAGERIVNSILRQTADAHKTRRPFQPTHAGASLAAAKRQISHAPATMIPGAQRVQPRELLPHQKALLEEHQALRTEIVVPTSRARQATNAIIRNAHAQKREINEKKLRELTNSKPPPTIEPKFELTRTNRSDEGNAWRVRAQQKFFSAMKPKDTEGQSDASSAPNASSGRDGTHTPHAQQTPASQHTPALEHTPAPQTERTPPPKPTSSPMSTELPNGVPRPALLKRKRPTATNIFMTKKQKR